MARYIVDSCLKMVRRGAVLPIAGMRLMLQLLALAQLLP